MRSVAIVGVGLIGGSFGLALRKAGFQGPILGVSSARSISEGIENGCIDRGATLAEAAGDADLIFLSQPISGILGTIRLLNPLVNPNALVTDAGSAKQTIVEEAARSLTRCEFVDVATRWPGRSNARGERCATRIFFGAAPGC